MQKLPPTGEPRRRAASDIMDELLPAGVPEKLTPECHSLLCEVYTAAHAERRGATLEDWQKLKNPLKKCGCKVYKVFLMLKLVTPPEEKPERIHYTSKSKAWMNYAQNWMNTDEYITYQRLASEAGARKRLAAEKAAGNDPKEKDGETNAR
jgi:hypothetical protein